MSWLESAKRLVLCWRKQAFAKYEANIFVRLWRLLGPFQKDLKLYVLWLLGYEGLQIFESYVPALAVRLFVLHQAMPVWATFFLGLLVFRLLYTIFDNRLDWFVVSRQGYPVFKYLKLAAVRKFLTMDIPWHNRQNSGALVGKVNNGVGKVSDVVDQFSWEFIPTFVQTLLTEATLLVVNPAAAAISVPVFVIFLILTYRSVTEKRPYKERRNDLYEDEWHRSVELVQTVETSLMFGQQDRFLAEQEAIHDRIMGEGLTEARIGIFKYNRVRIWFLSTARWLLLLIWVYQLYQGSLDIANFIFVSTMSEKLFSSFWRFGRLFDRLAEAIEPVERLEKLLAQTPLSTGGSRSQDLSGSAGIHLHRVHFSYDPDRPQEKIFRGLTLEIHPGSIVAIVGPSGAGKTTLRKIITGLWPTQSGKIFVGDLAVTDWQQPALLSQIAYVPQGDEVAMFARSIAENIAIPQPRAAQSEIERAARLAGIHEFVSSLPEGYQTLVGERGKRLSGGQKQRVALARAVLADRPILILDEATNALDAITEDEIQHNLRELMRGRTVIIIAHRLSTIWDIADKIVVMDRGRIVEQGSHRELVKLGGLYAQMAALQSQTV